MKTANFDVSHELDEFLMVEKPLTHSKRKANPDLEKMKPELRQLEEQFTIYNFEQQIRASYYPHNEQVNARETETQHSGQTIDPNATVLERSIIERSRAGTPTSDFTHSRHGRHPSNSISPQPPNGSFSIS
jgi:serine/threonine kinase 32